MRIKQWEMAPLDKALAAEMAEVCELHPFLSLLLTAGGMTAPEEMMAFLVGQEEEADPLAFADMEKAVERIQTAISRHERILIYGDYDVDGITATVLLYSYLSSKGANVLYRLPKRETGYGMHMEDIVRATEEQVKLIVTVDTGISLTEEEMQAIADGGMELVVTDHHQPPEVLPKAVAVVDPHRLDCESTCKDYAGVGVAFMLVCALEGDGESILTQYGDLLTLGTLADAVPLRGFTRDLVRRGLELLNASQRPGLLALRQVAGYKDKPLTATAVNFTLVPRLNAAGRMADPLLAAELLLAKTAQEAETLAQQLQECNVQRQEASRFVLEQATALLKANPQWLYDRVLIISGQQWPAGVLGIVAARLAEQYGKPTIVLTEQEDVAHGSGRSIGDFSLYGALRHCDALLDAFGGHEQAAGMSLSAEKIAALREQINAFARANYPQMPVSKLAVTLRLRPDQIDVEKLALLDLLEPFGVGNPSPLFGLFQMKLDNITAFGNGKHLRLSLSRGNARINAMKFHTTPEEFPIPCGSSVNCIVSLEKNTYRGTMSVSICVRDISYAETDRDALQQEMQQFEAIMRRELHLPKDMTLPSRELLAKLYSLLHRCKRWKGTLEQLLYAVSRSGGEEHTPPKALPVLVAIELWRQAGLLTMEDRGDCMELTVLPTETKADLTTTPLWQYLEEE